MVIFDPSVKPMENLTSEEVSVVRTMESLGQDAPNFTDNEAPASPTTVNRTDSPSDNLSPSSPIDDAIVDDFMIDIGEDNVPLSELSKTKKKPVRSSAKAKGKAPMGNSSPKIKNRGSAARTPKRRTRQQTRQQAEEEDEPIPDGDGDDAIAHLSMLHLPPNSTQIRTMITIKTLLFIG